MTDEDQNEEETLVEGPPAVPPTGRVLIRHPSGHVVRVIPEVLGEWLDKGYQTEE